MTLPRSRGLVTLDEIRECMDRIDATLAVLTAAVKRLAERPGPPAPPGSPRAPSPIGIGQGWHPSQTWNRPRYAAAENEGRAARLEGKPFESCPYVGDRGVGGARRKWWRYGWATAQGEVVP